MSDKPGPTEGTTPDANPPDADPEQPGAEADEPEQGNNTSTSESTSEPIAAEARPDVPGPTDHYENPAQASGVQQPPGNVGVLQQAPQLPPGYAIPGSGAPPYYLHPPYQPGVLPQPFPWSQLPLPPLSQPGLPPPSLATYAIPGTGAPPFDTSGPGYQSSQPEDAQAPLSGFAQPPLPPPPPPANAIPGSGPPPPYLHPPYQPEVVPQVLPWSQLPLPPFSQPGLPPPSLATYAIPGTGAPPFDTSGPGYQSSQPEDAQAPLSGFAQPPLPLPPPPANAIPGSGPPPFYAGPGPQLEDIGTSPYGYSQPQYDPYSPYHPFTSYTPNWTVSSLPAPYPSLPHPDLSNTLPDNTRTIEHLFAGYLFNIRTDAKVASKKLRVKLVDNQVEYYCSDVLLTKIKYKLQRDIFSLYEDSDTEPLRDAKLCEKIEILIGPIVAGLFEEPWSPNDFKFAWGVRECEGIGDGNFFHVDVFRDLNKYDSPSRDLQPSSAVRSRPVVADMDAFHRIPSVEVKGDLSRNPYAQHSIDHAQLLNVLRQVELLTAIELGKRSDLTGSAVASVIGREDYTLADRKIYKTFRTEVPTLFGLFVLKLPRWSKIFSQRSMYFGSRPRLKSEYGDEEEPLESQVQNEEESSTMPNGESVLPAGYDFDKLAATLPDVPPPPLSVAHSAVGVGSEEEDDTTLDGQSQSSCDCPFGLEDSDFSSEDEDQGGSERQSQASDEDLNARLNDDNGDLLAGADTTHTERIHTNTFESIHDSQPRLSDKPSSTLDFQSHASVPTSYPPDANYDHIGSGSSSQLEASNDEVSANQNQQWHESQEKGTEGEGVESDGDAYLEAEGHTNLQQEKPSKNLDHVSHASSAQEPCIKSQDEYQSQKEKQKESPTTKRESSGKGGSGDSHMMQDSRGESDTSLNEEQMIGKNQGNRQAEEGGLRIRDSCDEETAERENVSVPESGDIRGDQLSTLRQPDDVEPKPQKKVRFTIPSPEQSESGGKNGSANLEDERHKDEFNEARRAHLRAAYPSNPLQEDSPAYSYNFPTYSYLPQNPSPQSSGVTPSVVEPYQEAVAAGQIYDVPSHASGEPPKHGGSPPGIPPPPFIVSSSVHHAVRPNKWLPWRKSKPSDLGALPRPATLSTHSGLLSRKSSHKPMHDGDLSWDSMYGSYAQRKKNRIPLLIAKDTLSVILGVVIVILSILAVALDPAAEENWFKRVEEGVFVMFSLGIPLLIAMRSRLTHSLKIRMPKLTREVRSIQHLEKLNKRTDREDFVKQLQRELLFNEKLSMLFSPRDACYKLSRTSGNLVVPERAKYTKVFRKVWFFGEEHAYNKILGRAFRYQMKDNILMIENESVDIEGVIVHGRRRRMKYTFGSTPER